MVLADGIELAFAGFIFGLCASGGLFYKLAAMMKLKTALWKS